MQARGWMAISALLIGSVGITAQGPGGWGGFRGGFGGRPGKVVTGVPYTASSTSTSIEKLTDGTTITHSSTGVEARDSMGRTVHTTTTAGGGSGASFTRTAVMDPVAQTLTNWGSQSTTATSMQLPNFAGGWGGNGNSKPANTGGPPNGGRVHPQVTTVTLTPKTIAGVNATGVKTTITIPAGAEGNDKPIVSTREVWTSTDLNIVVLEISDSPRDGFHKMEVTSLTPGEPNATLFQVPQGYTVKAQTRHRGQ